MDSNYKFINLVDPSRCSAKIKDKFAKLTLSSNKKKQDESEMPQEVHEKIVSKRISRNLLSELLTDDESDKDEKDKSQGNLLMRTDSSPLSIANRQLGNPELHDVTGTTHCSQIECDAPEKSLEMEPLVYSFTENTQQIDEEIEKLSSRVSSLAVNNGQPIRINSEVNPHEVSRLVSTDHQRIGIGQVSSPVKLRAELKKEPDISICISSDDDDDTKSESDAPITITDSSEAEDEKEPLKAQPEEEHEPNVSSIVVAPSSSQSMTTVKANQMAAFLRDVRRNYGLPSATPDRDFERRQHDIATADTEPMTAENDSRSAGTARRIATADTESMTESTEKEPSPNANQSRRLALDDTEDNTRLDDSLHSSRHYNPVVRVAPELLDESVHKSSEPIPDDSLTIAETSEEEDEDPQPAAPPSCGISSALKKSESLSQVQRSSSSMTSSGDTSVQINFSAKINIKIQVSSQQLEDSSSSQSLMDSFQSNDKSTTQSIEEQDVGQSSAQKAAPNQSRAIEDIPHSPPERDVPSEEPLAPPETPAGDFMQKAQQLLNELYGDQWMTPQVLKSLKKVPNSSASMIAKKKKTPVTKRVPRESEEKPQPRNCSPQVQKSPMKPAKPSTEPSDDSVLADFSIFRRNIPQDLDSTRLAFPHQSNFKPSNEMTPLSKPKRRQPKPSAPAAKADPPTTVDVTKTRSGREVRQNWRKVVDSDTETEEKEASSDSERSWEKPTKKENIENRKPRTNRGRKQPDAISRLKDDDEIVYLDLTKGEVEIQNNVSSSPPANNDEGFNNRLKEILKSCRYEDKPKLATPGSKSKRKLFSAQINEDFDNIVAPCSDTPRVQKVHADEENVSISGAKMPSKYEPFNKYLESVKRGQPIFKIQTPKANRKDDAVTTPTKTPKSAKKEIRVIDNISDTPRDKYGFLKSLDLCVGKSNCHPDALYYRDNFRLKKEELATKLYEIYNQKCFDNRIDVPLVWNKKLTNTAGRCMNKKRLGERTCVVELSDKVLTSADRLRCTLIHELCHAATWILNGESGHGATWKAWARKANCVFPELPKIGVCHQYEIEYKYTYKCTLCGAKSHAHSKSKKVENIRCSYCHGAIEVYLNKKDKEGNMVMTPVKEPTGFAKFVKDKYKDFKKPDLKHADVMKLLSTEFASMKVDGRP